MKRSKPLPRSSRIARGGRPKKVNRARRNREWLRSYGSDERVAFIQSLPCIVTGASPCENVHILGGGMGRKSDARMIVPMISKVHRRLHMFGPVTFQAMYGVNLLEAAAETERLWQAYQTRSEP